MFIDVDEKTVAAKSFCCNGCGAPLKIPKNLKGHVQCPYCRNDFVLESLVKNADIAARENIGCGFPLTASPVNLHRQIVNLLSESPHVPPDIFEKIEVVREERYCVSAYRFNCDVKSSFKCELSKSEIYGKKIQEHGENGSLYYSMLHDPIYWDTLDGNLSMPLPALFVSGNKKFAQHIEKLYAVFDTDELIDIKNLDFSADVDTYNYDLTQSAAFEKYAVPCIEKMLKEGVNDYVKNQKFRNLSMGKSDIKKNLTGRVFLGLYRVVLNYDNKEYSAWIRGDGERAFCEELPEDTRSKTLDSKKQQMEAELSSIPEAKIEEFRIIGVLLAFLFFCLFVLFCIFDNYPPIVNTPLIGIGILLFILFSILLDAIARERYYKTQHENIRMKYQKDLKDLNDFDDFQSKAKNAAQTFREQKKALRGIYEEVTGDAEAFLEILKTT